jgi:AraC-like DNA-binding protein
MDDVKQYQRIAPERIQVDNGSEFIRKDLDRWVYENNVTFTFSRTGKPTDNPYIESFNGLHGILSINKPEKLSFACPKYGLGSISTNKIIMTIEISQNILSFTLSIFSILLVFDILIKQKKSLRLKIIFLLMILPILIDNLLIFTNLNSVNFFNIFQLMKLFFAIGILQLLSSLHFNKFVKFINIISIAFIILFLIRIIYTSYFNIDFSSEENMYYFFDIQPLNTVIKLPLIFEVLRLIIQILFIGIVFYFWYQIIFKFKFENNYQQKIQNFSFSVVFFIFLLFVFFITKILLKNNLKMNINSLITSSLQLYILLAILYRPSFLNRINGNKIALLNRFNYTNKFEIDVVLFDYMFFNKQSYIQKDFNLKSFADTLDTDKENLSVYIYNRFGLNFEDLLNKYRVNYFIDLIKNPEYNNLTIDALSKEAGFISRNAFYKPFKKFHGGNPSDLINLYS